MNLLERYLYAIRGYLPKAQADDIVRELSDSIQTQMEDREAQLGRSLTPDEQATIIKSHGYPLLAASRYWRQRYLIGPDLLPFYWRALKIALIAVVSVSIAIDFVIGIVKADAVSAFLNFWGSFWTTAFLVFGVITLIFALLERYQPERGVVKWDPLTLPAIVPERVARFQSAVELCINGAFALWLSGTHAVHSIAQASPFGAGMEYIAGLPFSVPWLHRLVISFFIVAIVHVMLNVTNLVRPDWFRLRAWVISATSVFLLIVTASILSGGISTLVVPGPGSIHVEHLTNAVRILNRVALGALAAMSLGFILTIALNFRYLLPNRNRSLLNVGTT